MSNETGSYECEYCGTEFESGPKKAGHISQNHREDQQRDEFIHALQRLATELGHSPTMSEMDEKGRYTRKAYITEFGTWNDALREAGLEINKPSTVSKAEVVEAIQSLSEQLGHPPTVEEMNEYGQYSRKAATKHFGSWNNALRSVGFEPNHEEIPREELILCMQQTPENMTECSETIQSCISYELLKPSTELLVSLRAKSVAWLRSCMTARVGVTGEWRMKDRISNNHISTTAISYKYDPHSYRMNGYLKPEL